MNRKQLLFLISNIFLSSSIQSGFIAENKITSIFFGFALITTVSYVKNKYNTFVLKRENEKQKKALESRQEKAKKEIEIFTKELTNTCFVNSNHLNLQVNTLEKPLENINNSIVDLQYQIERYKEVLKTPMPSFDSPIATLMELYDICKKEEYLSLSGTEKKDKKELLEIKINELRCQTT